ncbi:MAG: response regulator [Ardenticatenaceae bacterium]|nr:response regulator [Ardenticatenaceae bacterium]
MKTSTNGVPLRNKLILIMALLALVPLGALAYLNGRITRQALIDDANQALFAVASQTAASLDAFIQANIDAIHTEAQVPALVDYLMLSAAERPGSRAEYEVMDWLDALSQKNKHITSYALLDNDGIDRVDTDVTGVGDDKSDRLYFQAFQNDAAPAKAYVSPVLVSPEDGTAVFYFSSPVYGEQGTPIGLLRVRYSADVLQELLVAKNDQAGPGSFGVLFDEYHIHLAHGIEPDVNFIPIVRFSTAELADLKAARRLPDLPDEQLFIMQLDDLEEHLSNPETQRFFEAEDIATGDLVNQVAIAQLETMPWLVTFFQPQEIFLAPVAAQTRATLILASIIAVITLLTALIVTGWLVQPIRHLTQVVGEFTAGTLAARAHVHTRDEIGMLGDSFNAMAAQVSQLLSGLEQRTKELEMSIREAEEARAAADEANQAKSAFLANMSHELRTPLNAIIGFTRIVRRKGEPLLPEKQVDNLDKVLISAEHLLGLINTILDIAKIEAGRMDVQPVNFMMTSVIDACVATTQPLLKPGVQLTQEIAPDLLMVFSDLDKVKQILLNLLSNAAKFTHDGEIRVKAYQNEKQVVVTVEDNGIGISPAALERIFEEFQQADASTTRQYGGTGLGLSISKRLARLLDGDLTATSTMGAGSTFTLTFARQYGRSATISTPLPPTRTTTASHSNGKPLILAIDDNPDTIDLLQENLSEVGYRVIGASAAEEGLRQARELQPQVITLDIMMPQKDGWQVLHDLKNDPLTKNIPVVMLTIVDKKALGFQLGAADYLLKPLDSNALLATLARLLPQRERPSRLLVIDDDAHVRDMVTQLMEGQPFDVVTAVHGIDGLEAIRRQQPDVILLDLMMPYLDGFGVLEQLRRDPVFHHIPVIVLTAKTLTPNETTLLQNNAVQVMQKQGLAANDLLEELQKILVSGQQNG